MSLVPENLHAQAARAGTLGEQDVRIDCYRGSGPGGQKRNKTSSAVRATHVPSGISATASESRSQQENRLRAMQRLRRQMTLQLRIPTADSAPGAPVFSAEISRRSVDYLKVLGFLLDVLADTGWSISDAAARLGTSTAQVVKFLRDDDDAWTLVNQRRRQAGHKPLT